MNRVGNRRENLFKYVFKYVFKYIYFPGWKYPETWDPEYKAGVRTNYYHLPMLIGEKPGKALKYEFTGNAVGIVDVAGPDEGIIEYRIDKERWKKKRLVYPVQPALVSTVVLHPRHRVKTRKTFVGNTPHRQKKTKKAKEQNVISGIYIYIYR